MKNTILTLMGILTLSFACSKDETKMRMSSMETPVITGIELRDEDGSSVGSIGVPNNKLSDGGTSYDSKYHLTFYPSPCRWSTINIRVESPNPNSKKEFWFVKALFMKGESISEIDLGTNLMSIGGYPLWSFESTSETSSVDLTGFEAGYYRLYLKIDDVVLYDNLLIMDN